MNSRLMELIFSRSFDSASEKLTLLAFAYNTEGPREMTVCVPISQIVRDTDLSTATVVSATKKLIAKRFLMVSNKKRGRSKMYCIPMGLLL